jgi:C-terminal processing protease CtpA/Prc
VYGQKESKDDAQEEVKGIAEETGKTVEAQSEYVAEKVDETREAVEAMANEAKEAVDAKAEEIKEAAENAADAPAVAVAGEKEETVEAKPETCTRTAEDPPEQKTPVAPLILVVGMKGQARKTVEFVHKSLGFEYSKKAGCAPCGSKGNVTVSKVEANQQAATLGVQRGAIIYQVNGKDIADPNQLRDLIAEHLPKLPEASVCN